MAELLELGSVFAGDYRVVRRLSAGGMGAVYVVLQLSTEKERALKVMQPGLLNEPSLRARFVQEARVSSRVDSDHVVEVLAAGIDEPTKMPWLVMELLKGEELADFAAKHGPIGPSQLLEIFEQLCHAVGAAHAAGIVHRDLKPENIFLSASRRSDGAFMVKVLDFGIAKVVSESQTAATATIGTPLWMAPEQAQRGKAITPASDVWPLGLIAFRLLTGHVYWLSAKDPNADPVMILTEMMMEPIVSASERARVLGFEGQLPDGFDEWFAMCVDRDASKRYRDASEALVALERTLGTTAPVKKKASPASPNRRREEPPVATIAAQPLALEQSQPPAARARRSAKWLGLAGVGLVAVIGTAFALSRKPPSPVATQTPATVASVASAEAPASVSTERIKLDLVAADLQQLDVVDVVKPVVDELGPNIDLQLTLTGFSFSEQSGGEDKKRAVASEARKAALCSVKHAKRPMDLLGCLSKDPAQAPKGWEPCVAAADESAAIRECVRGAEGARLLQDSYERRVGYNPFTTTVRLQEKEYRGPRHPNPLKRAVCRAFQAPPPACVGLAAPAVVEVTALFDSRCADCRTDFREELEEWVENAHIKEVDYATPEGRSLWSSIGGERSLPLLIFDRSIEDNPETPKLKDILSAAGDKRLMGGGTWDPRCGDDGGCSLEQCKSLLQCRTEVPQKLTIHLMSLCPYAARALASLKVVLEHFTRHGAKLDVTIDFIGSGEPGDFHSLHGPSEVDEDLRELCAAKLYDRNDKFLEYMWCRSADFKDTNWQACATNGIDAGAIQKCTASDEAKKQLAASFKLSMDAHIDASPTFVVNNKYKFSSTDPYAIKDEICRRNALAGCDAALGTGPAASP